MVPPKVKFWSIPRRETLESQKKHALRNRFLRTLLCSDDIFIPGYNRKMLMRKRTSFLDVVCVNYEQLFHPVYCSTCKICQCSSRDKCVLPVVTGILWFSDQYHCVWCINCFGNGTRQHSTCLYQSGSLRTLFSYFYNVYILGEIFLLCNQSFQCSALVAFQPQSL